MENTHYVSVISAIATGAALSYFFSAVKEGNFKTAVFYFGMAFFCGLIYAHQYDLI